MSYIVELEKGVWLAYWPGDPGRTLQRSSARVYKTKRGARIAAGLARRFRRFCHLRITPAPDLDPA